MMGARLCDPISDCSILAQAWGRYPVLLSKAHSNRCFRQRFRIRSAAPDSLWAAIAQEGWR